MTTRLFCAVAGIVTVLLLGACSSDDGAGGDTTTSSSSAADMSPSTTNTVATTAITSSTTSTTTASTLPPNTTTTVDDVATTKQAVANAAISAREAYLYAVYNLDAADALGRIDATMTPGPSRDLTLANLEMLRRNGWRARPRVDVPDTIALEGEVQLVDGPPATRAEVTVCTVSAGVIYEPGAAPDGSDTVVNDEVVARRELRTMVLDGAVWKLYSGTNLGTWSGVTTCPDA